MTPNEARLATLSKDSLVLPRAGLDTSSDARGGLRRRRHLPLRGGSRISRASRHRRHHFDHRPGRQPPPPPSSSLLLPRPCRSQPINICKSHLFETHLPTRTHTPTRKISTIDVSARRDCTGTRRLATILHRASPIISKFESGDLNCIYLTGTTPKKTKPRKRKPNTHRAVSVSLKKTAKPKCDVRDGITKVKNGCPDHRGPLQCVGDALAHRVHASHRAVCRHRLEVVNHGVYQEEPRHRHVAVRKRLQRRSPC